nr:MAG: rep protein [Cressdnaviricota sp.]
MAADWLCPIFRFNITRKIGQAAIMKFMDAAKAGQRVKCWFATWPKCTIPKEVALTCLEKKADISEYVIAEEHHKDGTPHLHAYLKLKNKRGFKPDMFDLEDLGKTWHGNYAKCRSVSDAIEYLQKEHNYISNINVENMKAHKSKLQAEDFLKDPVELLEDGKITFFQISNFLKNQDCYKMLLARKTTRPETCLEKKRHHWIAGESNTGKTQTLWKNMDEIEGGWFQIPTNNDWKGYNGEKNLYLDEYKGQLTLQELNRICDGGAKVNTKGGSTQLG